MSKIIRIIRNINIQKRLLISFLIIIFLPNIIISITMFNKLSKEITSNVEDYTFQIVSNINKSISGKLGQYEKLSEEQVILNDRVINLLKDCNMLNVYERYSIEETKLYTEKKKNIQNLLYNMSDDKNIISIQIITDKDQYSQVSSGGQIRGGFVKEIGAFRKLEIYKLAAQTSNYLYWDDSVQETPFFLKQGTNYSFQDHITMYRNISDRSGNHLGVLLIAVSSRIFLDMNSMQKVFKDGNLLLVSTDRVIVSINENVKVPPVNKIIIGEIQELMKGNIIRKIKGVKYNIIFKKLEYGSLKLVYVVPNKILFKQLLETRDILLKVFVLCVLFASILSYIVSISIYNPLNKLRKTMHRVEGRNFDVRYKDVVVDEISMLGTSFNEMIEQIQDLTVSLQEVEIMHKTEELRRKEAEIDAFQMQINPHLIYNTLDIIRWQVVFAENGEGEVSKMIMNLSDLLKLSIKRSSGFVNISEEINHVYAYERILKYRYKDKFKIQWNIESEDLHRCKIVKLVLQPLIENAIVHGLRNTEIPLEILISIYKKSSDIHITVEDNGKGMTTEALEMARKKLTEKSLTSSSIALYNINERIKLCFGDCYGLFIDSQLDVGTVLNVCIPYRIE